MSGCQAIESSWIAGLRCRSPRLGRIALEDRPRLNYSFAPRRIERLKATPAFRDIASSDKSPGKERDEEIRYGKSVQQDILLLLGEMDGRRIYLDRDEFRRRLEAVFRVFLKFPDDFWDVLMDALSEPEAS